MRIYLLFHPYGLFNIRLHIERRQTFNLFLQPFAGCAKRIMDIHSFQTSSHVWFDRHISAFQGIFFLMHNSPYNIFLLVSNFLISSSFFSFIFITRIQILDKRYWVNWPISNDNFTVILYTIQMQVWLDLESKCETKWNFNFTVRSI